MMYENRDYYSQVASENWSNLYPDWGNASVSPVEQVICGGGGRQGGHQVVHLAQQLVQLIADEVLLHTAVCTMQCCSISMRIRMTKNWTKFTAEIYIFFLYQKLQFTDLWASIKDV